MASKRRLRRKSCTGKQRFTSRQDAKDRMFSLIRSGRKKDGFVQIYPCQFCGGFHFGHRPRKAADGSR